MNFPVFDLHCDTALALMGKDLMGGIDLKKNDLHIDLERASKLPGYAQCFACFTTPAMRDWYQASPLATFEREMGTILSEIEKNNRKIRLAYTAKDVRDNLEKGIMSAILTIEGPAGFSFDPGLLKDLYLVGFRMTTLGWNEQNLLVGSHKTGGSLTDTGRLYVKEAQKVGMMVDVSHIPDVTEGDLVTVVGRDGEEEITFDELAAIAGTISYELVCLVGKRVPRVCRRGGEVVDVFDYLDL